eukprot:6482451-Alexandrium_andersonii.AAC.1
MSDPALRRRRALPGPRAGPLVEGVAHLGTPDARVSEDPAEPLGRGRRRGLEAHLPGADQDRLQE